MFLVLAELIVVVAVLGSIVVQVAVPLWNGTPLFPMLSLKKARVEAKLAEARQDVEVAEAESLLESLRAEAKAYSKEKK